ncbi:MAG: 30S ribosomal protein S12 methylthiotransferase RimO [Candidatus Marinimicrobia bacterium]|mgnify:FL=1|nr:30S ribosomal protein S12 methylthiotransferase RimO [Candidatus Neomarinimicrobiota bacterium]MDP6500481.1 30S ribosomal protein S12 methylthiotransferase RimO [Candidatus Neomarinimicrobiota bacterium]MDP6726415.1 30S ribosomal protein S12 methylthiotransferase RimO [Candidatus Neomarinimicrobiota bacterium]
MKIHMISLGCAKALVDSEILLGGLKQNDVEITQSPEEAETVVVNTCGFLDIAREESVETILQAAELKKSGDIEQLVVMGCLSERYPEELAYEIPEVDRFFGSNNHRDIVTFLSGKEFTKDDPLFFRSLMTPNHYAYLKIAEGCDNGCSFCSIPIMRGLQKSRPISAIVSEAQRLADKGVKEMLIIAQDSTSYGWDLEQKVNLSDLIYSLDESLPESVKWLRIHYAHPAHLSQRIIEAMAATDRVCNYLDIPIQHASDKILSSMRRGLGKDKMRERIQSIRDANPGIALRTTLIVGYPDETEEDFNELYDFVQEIHFDRLGVFTYSEEDDTLAADLDDNVSAEEKDERKSIILDLQAEISAEKNKALCGQTLDVLVDEAGETVSVGRTEFDSPEVDQIVHIKGVVEKGEFCKVQIENSNEFELIGSSII